MVESFDGKVKHEISAFKVKEVTSGMKVINWNKHLTWNKLFTIPHIN